MDIQHVVRRGQILEAKWLFSWTLQSSKRKIYNCIVEVSYDLGHTYQILRPYEPLSNGYYEENEIPCHVTEQINIAHFRPDNISCEVCIFRLKLVQIKPEEFDAPRIILCSHIMIYDQNLEKCLGQCWNGGVCSLGKCICPPDFTGEICQNRKGNQISHDQKAVKIVKHLWLAVLLLALILIILLLIRQYLQRQSLSLIHI
eukprot:TRINITY_DN8018_c0_g1_i3.p1 TRINITY_DN8018_c0_g1~~TRINITY_DN8018_c0_g1_i3.p1  ORF type:complete len:201 (+),score=4.77 TRINITY_DN8018_c0_g1_i3:268-870(+)